MSSVPRGVLLGDSGRDACCSDLREELHCCWGDVRNRTRSSRDHRLCYRYTNRHRPPYPTATLGCWASFAQGGSRALDLCRRRSGSRSQQGNAQGIGAFNTTTVVPTSLFGEADRVRVLPEWTATAAGGTSTRPITARRAACSSLAKRQTGVKARGKAQSAGELGRGSACWRRLRAGAEGRLHDLKRSRFKLVDGRRVRHVKRDGPVDSPQAQHRQAQRPHNFGF